MPTEPYSATGGSDSSLSAATRRSASTGRTPEVPLSEAVHQAQDRGPDDLLGRLRSLPDEQGLDEKSIVILLLLRENRVALSRRHAGRHPVDGSAGLEVMLDDSAGREHPRCRVRMELHALATSRDANDLVERQRLSCQHDRDRVYLRLICAVTARTNCTVYTILTMRWPQATPRSSSAYVIPTRRIPRGPGS